MAAAQLPFATPAPKEAGAAQERRGGGGGGVPGSDDSYTAVQGGRVCLAALSTPPGPCRRRPPPPLQTENSALHSRTSILEKVLDMRNEQIQFMQESKEVRPHARAAPSPRPALAPAPPLAPCPRRRASASTRRTCTPFSEASLPCTP